MPQILSVTDVAFGNFMRGTIRTMGQNMDSDTYSFDIALSFAGEDRQYVEEVAKVLRLMGFRVFYDKYETVSLWGKNLYTHLSEVYL